MRVRANGIEFNVTVAGQGPAVLLLHGWPHTNRLWHTVLPRLASTNRVLAPDLRGLGDSDRPEDGYDAGTIAEDLAALLTALGEHTAAVVAIDAAVPAAFLLAMRAPQRVRRLVLMESLLSPLPGADGFLRDGPPWWFGFHAVPGLAETVLVGHEAEYLDWFLRAGTVTGVDPAVRAEFVRAYTGPAALRAGFAYYRAGPANAALIARAARGRLTVPTMAVGGNAVGDALYRQLSTVADDLVGHVLPDCGHLVPLDRPAELVGLLSPFLG